MPYDRTVSCAIVVDPQGRLLLQQRDDVPNIIQPGKVALFGGHRDSGETALTTVIRELDEELSCLFPPERFEALGSYQGPDLDRDFGTLIADFFVVRNVAVETIRVTEGSLLVATRADLMEASTAPLTWYALNRFWSHVP